LTKICGESDIHIAICLIVSVAMKSKKQAEQERKFLF